MEVAALFPRFPDGFWSRIKVIPELGRVVAGLEDKVHRFHMTLEHSGRRIASVTVETPRVPASTCPGAGLHIFRELVGQSLALFARRHPKAPS